MQFESFNILYNNKEFFIDSLIAKIDYGEIDEIKLKGHDLSRPWKYLQEKLNLNNFIKEFLYKGGLRCEILNSGKISVGDIIKL